MRKRFVTGVMVASLGSGALRADWAGDFGLMAANAPAFDGASDRTTVCLPLLGLRWGQGYYLGRSQLGSMGALGYSTAPADPWVIIAEVGITGARLERRAQHLLGVGDRPENYWAGLGLRRNLGQTYLKLAANAGVRDGSGVVGQVALGHRLWYGGWLLEGQAAVAAASTQNLNYDFAVSEAAALRRAQYFADRDNRLDARDLGAYSGRGGLRDASASLLLVRPSGPQLSYVFSVQCKYLFGQASASPLVRDRLSVAVATGLSCRF